MRIWIPATPMPLYSIGRKCPDCSRRFLRFSAYERHWHRRHAVRSPEKFLGATMEVSIDEARQLGYEVTLV